MYSPYNLDGIDKTPILPSIDWGNVLRASNALDWREFLKLPLPILPLA